MRRAHSILPFASPSSLLPQSCLPRTSPAPLSPAPVLRRSPCVASTQTALPSQLLVPRYRPSTCPSAPPTCFLSPRSINSDPSLNPDPYHVAAPFAPLPPPPTFLHRANPCPSSPRPNNNSDKCPPHRSGGNGQQHARESTRSTQAEAVLGRIQGQVRRDGSDPPKNQIRPDTVHFWVSSPCARNLTVALATRQVGGLRLGVQGPRLCRKHL